MRPSPKPWPVVISRLVGSILATVKAQAVRGKVRVCETEERGQLYYAIVVLIPAGETVPARAV